MKNKPTLERYSRICTPCATENGGKCHKGLLWYTWQECEICGVESSCVSGKDYGLPKHDQIVFLKERDE